MNWILIQDWLIDAIGYTLLIIFGVALRDLFLEEKTK